MSMILVLQLQPSPREPSPAFLVKPHVPMWLLLHANIT